MKSEIVIASNDDEEMMEIYIPKGQTRTGQPKKKILFHGNDWDFDRSPQGIEKFIKEILNAFDIPIKIKSEKLKSIK
jgi:hypothetical protein